MVTRNISTVILEKFTVLESCGGYTLLRLAENSHNMVEIEGPDSGMTVCYLKDVLNQAKLYVRPLQRDISVDDMKPYSIPNVSIIYGCGGRGGIESVLSRFIILTPSSCLG